MADTKTTALSAFTPITSDILYGVDDPGGTPISGKILISALATLLSASPTLETPTLGVASATSLNLGTTTVLQSDGADILAQYRSTNAQTARFYNTRTDGSNGEWVQIGFTANVPYIQAKKNGTGTQRSLTLGAGATGLTINSSGDATAVQDLIAGRNVSGQAFYSSTGIIYNNGAAAGLSVYGNTSTAEGASLILGRDSAGDRASFHLEGGSTQGGDNAPTVSSIRGANARSSAVTNLVGGDVTIAGGSGASGSAGNAHGGNLYLRGGTKFGTGHTGYVLMDNLPTSAAGLPTGALWNNSGVVTVA